jgi:hypothetical protein
MLFHRRKSVHHQVRFIARHGRQQDFGSTKARVLPYDFRQKGW